MHFEMWVCWLRNDSETEIKVAHRTENLIGSEIAQYELCHIELSCNAFLYALDLTSELHKLKMCMTCL